MLDESNYVTIDTFEITEGINAFDIEMVVSETDGINGEFTISVQEAGTGCGIDAIDDYVKVFVNGQEPMTADGKPVFDPLVNQERVMTKKCLATGDVIEIRAKRGTPGTNSTMFWRVNRGFVNCNGPGGGGPVVEESWCNFFSHKECRNSLLEEALGYSGDAIGEILSLFSGVGQRRTIYFGATTPDTGSIPVIRNPVCAPIDQDGWFRPASASPGTHLSLEVHGTCRNGCWEYRWEWQQLILVDTEDGARFQWVGPGPFDTRDAYNPGIGPFANDGSLYRIRVQQMDLQGIGSYTVDNPRWCYFFSGTPQSAPDKPVLLSPGTNGDSTGDFNWAFFMVTQPAGSHIQMSHPDFKYRVKIWEVDPENPEQDPMARTPDYILPNENVSFDIVKRTREHPVGANLEPYLLPNEDAAYLWVAEATYAPNFDDNPELVATSDPGMFNVKADIFRGDSNVSNLGYSVDIWSNGVSAYAIAGAFKDDDLGTTANQGSAKIFELDDGIWSQTANLEGEQEDQQFGSRVAIEANLAVATSVTDFEGQADVFQRSLAGVWQQLGASITAPNPVPTDYFGSSVDLTGNVMAIGSRGHADGTAEDVGRVLTYRYGGQTWENYGILEPFRPNPAGGSPPFIESSGQDNDQFGEHSVVINGGQAIVPAPGRNYLNDEAQGSNWGGVYCFRRNGQVWQPFQELLPSLDDNYQAFGTDLALNELGDSLFVGAPAADGEIGKVYEFVQADEWREESVIKPLDRTPIRRDFGYSLAHEGETLLIGSPYEDDAGGGSVYVFRQVNGEWEQRAKLLGATFGHNPGARFGWSVAMAGRYAIIGAPYAAEPNYTGPGPNEWGRVHVFEIDVVPPVAAAVTPLTSRVTSEDFVTFHILFSEEIGTPLTRNHIQVAADPGVSFQDSDPVLDSLNNYSGSRSWLYTLSNLSGNGDIVVWVDNDETNIQPPIEDLGGNRLVASATGIVTVDNITPTVEGVTLNRMQAVPGQTVRLGFSSTEYTTKLPSVQVNQEASDITFLENALDASGDPESYEDYNVEYGYTYRVHSGTPQGVSNMMVEVEDDAGQTASRIAPFTVLDELLGDANGDGRRDIFDALLIRQDLAGLPVDVTKPVAADASDNVQVDVFDALYIQQDLVGLVDLNARLAAP